MKVSGAKMLTRVRRNRPRPTLLIRTVAGPAIGFGHLRRSLILAQHACRFARPVFLLDAADVWSRREARDCGFASLDFDRRNPWPKEDRIGGVLIDTRRKVGLGLLIAAGRMHRVPVISIHDLGLASLPSDIIIDGSISPAKPGKSCDRKSAGARDVADFMGTDYLVLQDSYGTFHRKTKRIRARIRKVAINLGGGNGSRFFGSILEGLRAAAGPVQVVGFPGFCSWGQERILAADWGAVQFRWLDPIENAAQVIFDSDLVISAGGLSVYEALCIGTPVCALAYDCHQEVTITALAKAGAAVSLGRGENLCAGAVAECFRKLDAGRERRRRLSKLGRALVDGKGAVRVVRILRAAMRKTSLPVSFQGDR